MPTNRAPVFFVAVAVGALLAACASRSASPGVTTPNTAGTASSTPTGNGIELYTANEIVDKVRVAVTIASSVHVKGMVTSTGQRQVDYDVLVSLPSGVATLTEPA